MRFAHFHAASRYFPNSDVEIEFGPFGGAHFAWADECQGYQFKRGARFGRSLVILDGAKQSAKGFR